MDVLKKARFLFIPVLLFGAIGLLLKLMFFLGYVPTGSMEPNISAGSFILGCRIYDELQRGDIVIFEQENKMLVKRIAAVGGDTVYIDDVTHEVSINIETDTYTRMLTVPDGYFFLLGDNAAESVDAKYWQEPFISAEKICAKLRK